MPVVIALVSQKGGVGKSTLARAIAAVAARAGLKVRLVDLDPQQRTLLVWEQARRNNEIWPEITIEALATSEGSSATAPFDDLLILDLHRVLPVHQHKVFFEFDIIEAVAPARQPGVETERVEGVAARRLIPAAQIDGRAICQSDTFGQVVEHDHAPERRR